MPLALRVYVSHVGGRTPAALSSAPKVRCVEGQARTVMAVDAPDVDAGSAPVHDVDTAHFGGLEVGHLEVLPRNFSGVGLRDSVHEGRQERREEHHRQHAHALRLGAWQRQAPTECGSVLAVACGISRWTMKMYPMACWRRPPAFARRRWRLRRRPSHGPRRPSWPCAQAQANPAVRPLPQG